MLKYLSYPILLICLLLSALEFWPTFMGVFYNLKIYQWMLYGMAAYFVFRKIPFYQKNEQWLQTFTHEMSHTVVGFMFFQKILSFRAASGGDGEIQRSGKCWGQIFINLAPYCLPIYTFAFVFLKLIGNYNLYYIFDIFIGFTLAFHIVCFFKQTRLYQADIKTEGYLRSVIFILTAWMFNATLILLSIRKGLLDSLIYQFAGYWHDIVSFF